MMRGRSRKALLPLALCIGAVCVATPYSAAAQNNNKSEGFVKKSDLTFHKDGQSRKAVIRNRTGETVTLDLELLDPKGAFQLPVGKITLKPKQSYALPVRYEEPSSTGLAYAYSGPLRGGVRIRDVADDNIVGTINFEADALARIRIEDVDCMREVETSKRDAGNDFAPSLFLEVDKPYARPGETVRFNYSTIEADEVTESWSFPGAEILSDGQRTDYVGGGPSDPIAPNGNFYVELDRTTSLQISARNDDGVIQKSVQTRLLSNVGYENVVTPSGPAYRSDMSRIRRHFESLEERLRDGCIRDAEELDCFGDPYLRGDLTDDILEAMQDVIVHYTLDTIPEAYTQSGPQLCQCPETGGECDGGCCVFGLVPADRTWASICDVAGANELTLLHEMYHYAADHDWESEPKAFAVSLACYDRPFDFCP